MTVHLAPSSESQLKKPIKWLGQDTPDDFELYVLDLPEPDEDDPDDYEMAPFDLSRVMSALQGMKEEIAGMENEDERRKAAAKVALGLVYGLEAERRGDGDRVRGEEA